MSERIAVLGSGSWGTALAVHCARIGHDVRLWGRDAMLMADLARTRENAPYLPGVALDPRIVLTPSLAAALEGAPIVIAAVPSHGMRLVLRAAAPLLRKGAVIVSAAKGLEIDSLERMSQVAMEETGPDRAVAALSGPSFALEVARGLPTAVVVASTNADAAASVQDTLKGPALRLYASDDVTGVEFGGALKNVIAIAAGVVEGLGIGHNAMAALITRGLVEMSRLACAEGSRRDTLAGLSGLGDLVLTCTGDLSRNRHVGIELGRGRSLAAILSETRMVAEGVRTTVAALALGARHGVELPLAAQMSAVLEGRTSARSAVEALMLRPQRSEADRAEPFHRPS
jgi:glycerol-3-phosphate dehydrogenase (NAD(P)+)